MFSRLQEKKTERAGPLGSRNFMFFFFFSRSAENLGTIARIKSHMNVDNRAIQIDFVDKPSFSM